MENFFTPPLRLKTVNSTSPHHFSGSKHLQSSEKKDKGCNFSLLRLYLLALLKNGRKCIEPH